MASCFASKCSPHRLARVSDVYMLDIVQVFFDPDSHKAGIFMKLRVERAQVRRQGHVRRCVVVYDVCVVMLKREEEGRRRKVKSLPRLLNQSAEQRLCG